MCTYQKITVSYIVQERTVYSAASPAQLMFWWCIPRPMAIVSPVQWILIQSYT